MAKLNKWLLFFPLLLLGLGMSQFNANSSNLPIDHSTCIQSHFLDAVQNDAVHHRNNLLNPHFRFHRGIFESSVDVSNLYTGVQPFFRLDNNSYEISHYSWYLFPQEEKIPVPLFLATPGPLRAPPLA